MTPPSTSLRTSLTGKRIVVTRPRAQASALCGKIAALGAEPILFPTIEIAPVDDYAALDNAIRLLSQYHWIIFTSVNGVAAFWNRLDLLGLKDLTGLSSRVGAIGPATARVLASHGVQAHLIPDEYVAEAILEKIGDVAGQWILLPRADLAREVLAVGLANRGAIVHEIAAYRTLPAAPDPNGLAQLRRGVDAVTFTSASTVRNFVALVGQSAICNLQSAIACIGPITAQTARDLGLPVNVMAAEYTTDGLIAALANHFAKIGETPR
ncbi:MAG: uroporphyrinogen-III synthase [Chloroflexi bacterium]|nr:uroporphyrinogen-III synthase [Chloroflexota bacterium]